MNENFHKIRCEGNFPDSIFSSLVKIKDQFGGKLFYEGKEWHEEDGEAVNEVKPLGKIWFSIYIFPHYTNVFIATRYCMDSL